MPLPHFAACWCLIINSFDIHLSNLGHVKIYTERCAKLGIATNNRVYAKSESLESIGQKQTTLDGVVTHQPRPPAFTTDRLLDYIIELVVSEDEIPSISFYLFPLSSTSPSSWDP
ncbi:hypothetical protein M378DRAFT_18123 [Amanita muscaria Koide BX008]|uniref:Uncharacterized protein n=1 Tax=Amanita muscaria (strain Koide BX008) TaxID=946122 RepID=A0A0C2WGK3_AMAMK|nr:hypothetical protein M378DRAFT_18123 [Amanita muscaria Koide BX008]